MQTPPPPRGASATDTRLRRPTPTPPPASPTPPPAAATPPPAATDSAARLAAPAGRSRRRRAAHPRDHHPGHRRVVLRDPDARARPAGPRLGSALAGHPDRPRRLDRLQLRAACALTWTQGDGSATDRAWLADWRRRVATLYAEVRGMAATDPAIALAHWRAVRESLFREHPQSPVPIAQRAAFRAVHFDHDPSLRFEVVIEPAPPPAPGAFALELPNSGADTLVVQPHRPDRHPVREPARVRCPCSGWPATRAASSSRSATRPTAPRRTAPAATSSMPRRARTSAATRPTGTLDPRLQLRVPAVVRLRPALGVPAGAAGEPPRHRRSGRESACRTA